MLLDGFIAVLAFCYCMAGGCGVWFLLRWWVALCMSWIILDSRELRMWRSLIWSVGIRIVCNCYLYVCVDYSTVNAVVTTYCSVVSGMALAVFLLACRNVLCSTSHLSVSSHFVYCYSGLVLGVGLGVVCSLEPSVGFVSDYSFE